MQFLVCQLNPSDSMPETATRTALSTKERVKNYHVTVESASTAARDAAIANPGRQYAVFGIVEIFESLPPAQPKILRKKINENGEIVVSS